MECSKGDVKEFSSPWPRLTMIAGKNVRLIQEHSLARVERVRINAWVLFNPGFPQFVDFLGVVKVFGRFPSTIVETITKDHL